MWEQSITNKNKPILISRFKQILGVTILLLIIATVSTLFLNFSSNTIFVLIADIIAMNLLFIIVKKNKIELAKQLYLWINLFVVSYIFWLSGGLISSSLVLAFPIYLMFSALFCGTKTFLLVFTFIVTLISSIGVATINGYHSDQVYEFNYWQIAITIIILSASGYVAWRLNSDMQYTLKKLKNEVENVKKSRSEIARLIHFDPLTGLSSKIDCERKYHKLKKDSYESTNQITFLLLDIDNFKSINDYYNLATGDELLKAVGSRLSGLALEDDIAARLSADEFLLVISRPRDYNLEQLAYRILQRISKPVELFDQKIEITVSIGVSFGSDADESFENVLKRADLAMHRAKRWGKNKCSFYDEELFMQSKRNLSITSGLKAALDNDDLELFLQPKVDLVSGEIKSAEALLRWVGNNPDNISAAEFIPLIDSTELICNIGEWVINKSCALCKHLHNHGFDGLSISVNISATQFVRGGLENIIINALQKSQLAPEFLELELTEHTLFQDDEEVLNELSRIKDLGVSLSIDDFGTGYSNLGYLSKFRVDSLKIDQSFIKDIHKLPEHMAIVDAIIKMAKTLGLKIVAEGVETNKEWSVLKNLDCDIGQGFLWSKPLTPKNFLKLVSEPV